MQIASLNTEIAKQKANLTATSAAAESFETMQETLRLTEQKFDDNVKELLAVKASLE